MIKLKTVWISEKANVASATKNFEDSINTWLEDNPDYAFESIRVNPHGSGSLLIALMVLCQPPHGSVFI